MNKNKLAPEVNRALFVKNLSYNVSTEELFDLFGKFGPIRQIRQGIASNTKGTAFVVYEDVLDAKSACDKLNGFNFQNRYLVVLYHQPEKMAKSQQDLAERQQRLEELKQQHGISSSEAATPIARDFAVPHNGDIQQNNREKHDMAKPAASIRGKQPRPATANSVKAVSFQDHPNKENMGMGRRLKDAMLTTFGGLKQ
ncbi:hypothetical protein CBER1_04736 [Cercospora berteroae]|uniref:RRM domain-containing protein n=1 Tax=Cercospora berteroae TaxID=357750 RepID=A0A2S6BR91_9PEZI|nr:hypothetical protein CBER1_04736 [Cercospora berteroae]